MSQSMLRFVQTHELLCYLGTLIRNRKLLCSLARTSRAFNDAFTPALYYNVAIDVDYDIFQYTVTGHLRPILANANARHTRELCVSVRSTDGKGEELGGLAIELLSKMPHLHTFRWAGPLPGSVPRALSRRCPRVHSVSISDAQCLADEFGNDWSYFASPQIGSLRADHAAFTNLRSLRILEMEGDIKAWRARLVGVLMSSPELEDLTLSFERNTLDDLYWMDCDNPEYCSFLGDLSTDYANAGGMPLRLRRLELWSGVLLWEGSENHARQSLAQGCITGIPPVGTSQNYPATYLAQLVDLRVLEEIYVSNTIPSGMMDLIPSRTLDDGQFRSGIAWRTISPELTPRLRILQVDTNTVEVYEAARELPREFSAQLAVLAQNMSWDVDLWDLPLRMLQMYLGYSETTKVPPVEELIDKLVEIHSDSLEGAEILVSDLDRKTAVVLLRGLSRLENLRQLVVPKWDNTYVMTGGDHEAEYNANADPKGEALLQAIHIATVLPKLQFVQVMHFGSWHVSRHGDGGVRLEELDGEEQNELHLFRYHS